MEKMNYISIVMAIIIPYLGHAQFLIECKPGIEEGVTKYSNLDRELSTYSFNEQGTLVKYSDIIHAKDSTYKYVITYNYKNDTINELQAEFYKNNAKIRLKKFQLEYLDGSVQRIITAGFDTILLRYFEDKLLVKEVVYDRQFYNMINLSIQCKHFPSVFFYEFIYKIPTYIYIVPANLINGFFEINYKYDKNGRIELKNISLKKEGSNDSLDVAVYKYLYEQGDLMYNKVEVIESGHVKTHIIISYNRIGQPIKANINGNFYSEPVTYKFKYKDDQLVKELSNNIWTNVYHDALTYKYHYRRERLKQNQSKWDRYEYIYKYY